MTARDRYTIGLRCGECGNEGQARLSENDGASFHFGRRDRTVDMLTAEFEVVDPGVDHGQDTRIKCCDCDQLAESFIP